MSPEDIFRYKRVLEILTNFNDLKLETYENKFQLQDDSGNVLAAFPSFSQVEAFIMGYRLGALTTIAETK
jgi:hypothetical protein